MDKNIVLIGMPAVGKTTIGTLLSQKIGLDFIDTDTLIKNKEKKSIPRIISQIGVKNFLLLEEKYLLSIKYTNHIIATGGSVIYSEKGMKHLSNNSIIVYLEIAFNYLAERLSCLDLDKRGVVKASNQSIKSLYLERTPLYRKYADIKIKCDLLTIEQILLKILDIL
ncbi:MAG: hypothetical protein B6I26_06605 [Desulfobacteraceae bacterium 4572_130]|nr:MAG: hypothetical protein B6I26_06605 [Desulfobacteraceae bacterium 4572_130]